MPTDVILTWRDYRDERPRTRTSIGNHREASYPDYLARLWEAYHDGLFEPAGLPAKPDTLDAAGRLRQSRALAGQVRLRARLRAASGAGGGRALPAVRRAGIRWNSQCSRA